MGWAELLKYISSEAAVISKAPLTFATALLGVFTVTYVIVRWAYATIISHRDAQIRSLEDRLKLRDDQLANKLASVPPNEAEAMIEELQRNLAELQPR